MFSEGIIDSHQHIITLKIETYMRKFVGEKRSNRLKSMYRFRYVTIFLWVVVAIILLTLLLGRSPLRSHLSHLKSALFPASYQDGIDGTESLVLAVGNDLRTYSHYTNQPSFKILDEINTAASELYYAGATPTKDGGWLLQPGKWKDHPDHLYAGHKSVPSNPICANPNSKDPRCNLTPMPVDGLGMDVSHFLAKWPIYLIAYQDASYDNQSRKDFFQQLLSGIEIQLFNYVIKPQKSRPYYLLTNYMDGTNGVYRWNYSNRGKNWGYNAFQLSNTPCYSSIALINNSDRIRELYKRIYQSLPYTPTEAEKMGGDFCNSEAARLMTSLSSQLDDSKDGKTLVTETESNLFSKSVRPTLLTQESWVGDAAYSGVVGQRQLLLYIAFFSQQKDWIDAFDAHFKLFTESMRNNQWSTTTEYYQWHQLLFASRYLALSAQFDHDNKIHAELYKYLYKRVSQAWESENNFLTAAKQNKSDFINYRSVVKKRIEAAKRWQKKSVHAQ